MTLGDRLRERRSELGMTQEAAAEKAGMHVTQYNGYERERSTPAPATLARLASALETTPVALLGAGERANRGENETQGDVVRRLRAQFRDQIAIELGLAADDVAIRIEIL